MRSMGNEGEYGENGSEGEYGDEGMVSGVSMGIRASMVSKDEYGDEGEYGVRV